MNDTKEAIKILGNIKTQYENTPIPEFKIYIDALQIGINALIESESIRGDVAKEFVEKVEKRCIERGVYPICVKRVLEQTLEEMTKDGD